MSAPPAPVRGPTLRYRLGLTLGVRLLLAWALTTLAVTAAVHHDLDELYDAGLLAAADVVAALGSPTSAPEAHWRAVPLVPSEASLVGYRLRTRAGSTARDAPASSAATPPLRVASRGDERVVEIALGSGTSGGAVRTVEIAQGLEERRIAILDVLIAMLVPALLFIPIGVLGLRATLVRELAPLDAFAAEIDRRDATDLSPMSATGVPGELDSVVTGLDRLLLRLRRALEAERGFAGTTAHELRTPVAGALAQTQRLIVETDGPTRERARRIERSLRSLQHLTTRLLELARADGAGTLVETAVDLSPALRRTVALIAEEGDDASRIDFDEGGGGPLISHLDPDAFSVLLRNLVENALVHGAPDAPVTVRRRDRRIDVDNAGPVLGESERDRLQARFARAGSGGGAGLGLSIVQAIVDGGGVDVELVSPVPGCDDGVRARIELEAPPGPRPG